MTIKKKPARKQKQPAITSEGLGQRVQLSTSIGADFESRRIYLVGEIMQDTAYHFLVSFHAMDEYKGPILISMLSGGGGEESGYAIYDALRAANNQTIIIGTGGVQSIAALILQGAHTRLVTPECRFMIHNGSLELSNGIDSDTLIAIGKEVEISNSRYHRCLAARSGLSIEAVRKYCQDETYFSAEETVEYGFADGILMPDGSITTKEMLLQRPRVCRPKDSGQLGFEEKK